MRLVYVSTGTSTHSRMLSSMRAIGRQRVARADPDRASIISLCSRMLNIRSSDSRESRECRLGDASRKLQPAEERERSERSSGSSEAFRECGMMRRVLKRILRASSLSIPLDSARYLPPEIRTLASIVLARATCKRRARRRSKLIARGSESATG